MENVDENGSYRLFPGPREYIAKTGQGEGQTSSVSEDWYTHKEIVDLTIQLYDGSIDLDPMSCEEANKTVKATTIYTAEQDGLTHPWYGKMLWNPPWGGSDASAVKKRGMIKLLTAYNKGEVTDCICVLNANATTTRWFAPLFNFPICFPPRRIYHYGPGGKGGAPNSGTVIVYVGKNWEKFNEVFGVLGAIMVLYQEK